MNSRLSAGDTVICEGPIEGTDYVLTSCVGTVVKYVSDGVYKVTINAVDGGDVGWLLYEHQLISKKDLH